MMERTKFFDKKKRDLSSKSNNGDDSKDRESPACTILLQMPQIRDVFTESLKSKDCVAILCSCMKSWKKR